MLPYYFLFLHKAGSHRHELSRGISLHCWLGACWGHEHWARAPTGLAAVLGASFWNSEAFVGATASLCSVSMARTNPDGARWHSELHPQPQLPVLWLSELKRSEVK